MKKVSKILLILLSFIMMFCTFNNNFSYAADDDDDTVPSWELTEKFDPGEWDPNKKERS